MGTGSFPGVKSCRGVTLTHRPLLVPWSRKSTAIPLLPLWAVRPVQSLSACTRVHFTFTFYQKLHDFVTYGEQFSTLVNRIPPSLNLSGIYTKFYTVGIFLIFDLQMTLGKEFVNMRDLNSCYWRRLKCKSP